MGTHAQSGETNLDVRVDQIPGLSSESLFHVSHYGKVHLGQTIGSVNPHYEPCPLTFRGNAVGQQQISKKKKKRLR